MAQPADAAPSGSTDGRPKAGLSSLQKRTLSALVLIPVVLLAIYLGYPYWNYLVLLFGGLMAWEWARICGRQRNPADAAPMARLPAKILSIGSLALIAMVVIAIVRGGILGMIPGELTVRSLVLWAAALAAVAAVWEHGLRAAWFGLGALYIVTPCLAIIWIRSDPDTGLVTMFWMLAVVIAADTGAYAAGRSIGGPKLAPRISPSKTWAGLGGGVISAGIVGLCAAIWLEKPDTWPLALVSAALAVAEQGGDLAESALKRHFGVKDSSHIIPGHGGVLDRVDGLLAVTVIVAALGYLKGSSVLTWL